MTRKAKNCYDCIAFSLNNRYTQNGGCLLGYEQIYDSVKDFYIPKECCHKPKTIKEFSERCKNRCK